MIRETVWVRYFRSYEGSSLVAGRGVNGVGSRWRGKGDDTTGKLSAELWNCKVERLMRFLRNIN